MTNTTKISSNGVDIYHQDLQNHEEKVTEISSIAEQLILDKHPEVETIQQKRDEVIESWKRLQQLSLLRQDRLYGAHEIQRFNRLVQLSHNWTMPLSC